MKEIVKLILFRAQAENKEEITISEYEEQIINSLRYQRLREIWRPLTHAKACKDAGFTVHK